MARGGGLVVPTHHFGALGLKGLQQHGHQGWERRLEQPQERPGGPGIDGHFRGFLPGEQVPGREGQGAHPGGQFAHHGGVVNDDPVRRQLAAMEGDGFLVQGH